MSGYAGLTVKELIEALKKENPELQVMFSDGQGGVYDVAGVSAAKITTLDSDSCGDCDGREGEQVVKLYKF